MVNVYLKNGPGYFSGNYYNINVSLRMRWLKQFHLIFSLNLSFLFLKTGIFLHKYNLKKMNLPPGNFVRLV